MSHIPPISMKVGSTVATQRILVGDSANAAKLANTITSSPIGVSGDIGDLGRDPVYGPGNIAPVLFNDTVAAWGAVASDSSGRGVSLAGITLTNTYIVGYLAGPAVAATGTIADILVMPQSFYGQV